MADLAGKKTGVDYWFRPQPDADATEAQISQAGLGGTGKRLARELLAQLQAGKYDAVVINGMDLTPCAMSTPELAVAFNLPEKQQIVWALPKGSSQALRNGLARFVERAQADGSIKRIYERYFGHLRQLDSSDILGILQRRPVASARTAASFSVEAQTLTGIDWRLLAAIGYQESQWNAFATSRPGARPDDADGVRRPTANGVS